MLRWKDGEFLNSSSTGAHYALGLRTKSGVWGESRLLASGRRQFERPVPPSFLFGHRGLT